MSRIFPWNVFVLDLKLGVTRGSLIHPGKVPIERETKTKRVKNG